MLALRRVNANLQVKVWLGEHNGGKGAVRTGLGLAPFSNQFGVEETDPQG